MRRHIILFLSLLFIFSCKGDKRDNNAPKSASAQDTLTPPQVTILADLPDSLQPKTIALDTVRKPTMVVVPASNSGAYSVTNAKGEVKKINLVPPVNKLLPVLLDAKGKPVTDSLGNNFIMGGGGLSNFTTFTTDNGLALDGISCSKMDRTGNLWFGTDGGGVSRYDGKSFTTFSVTQGLANNSVVSIAEDKTGNLWFGTYGGGVSRYDGKYFTTFSVAQGLADNSVVSIAEDKTGNLWFGTHGGGVSRYDGKSFTTFSVAQGLANNNVRCIVEDKTGSLWFGTHDGVSRYDPAAARSKGSPSFVTFTTAQGLANNNVRCMAEDKTGNLWFGTDGSGVSRYDGKSFTTFSAAQGLANNYVVGIAEDKTGNLWFGTDGGVSCYDGKSFTTYSVAQGLGNNSVVSIVEDKTGNLWFGTYGNGVSRFDGKSFTTFSVAHGLADNIVVSIAEDKTGNLWFGTNGGGVSRYNGKSFITFSVAQGLSNNSVLSIAEDKTGNLWFGTEGGGVSCYGPSGSPTTSLGSFVTYSTAQGLAGNIVRCIAEDKTGNLWFGTDGGGVSRYDPSVSLRTGSPSFTTFSVDQGLANNSVVSIAGDKTGNLWFGTNGGGVSRYDGKAFTTFSIAQGLADNSVVSITEDKTGNLWFGTANGLSVISRQEAGKLPSFAKKATADKALIFKTFTKTDGLPDNFVTQVLQMPNGKMAIGTNLGITLFNPSADFTKLNDIEIYNANTGCPLKDVNVGQNNMFLDSRGILWAGTGSQKTALVRFDPSALHINKEAPTLIIKSIKVNEESICWNDLNQKLKIKNQNLTAIDSLTTPANITEEVNTMDKVLTEMERDSMKRRFSAIEFDSITRFYPIPEHLVLPYRCNRITIDFNAVETGKPNLVNYQYMLEGYENAWSPLSKKTSATFGNIHEGSYTFKVKAQGPNGIWCEPVTYAFKVLPPWYRAWWAYSIYGILFLLTLRIFINWRERNLQIEKEKLEKTVQERTVQLKQSLEKQYELVREKDVLMKEIHHRVKNNLQVISGLLELQSKGVTDEAARNILRDGRNRLGSIALIHQNLYQMEHFAFVGLDRFVKDLCKQVAEVYKGLHSVEIKTELPDIKLDIDTAVPLGLILNELLTNSLKYAFTDGSEAEIKIQISQLTEGSYKMIYRDNGPGLPADFSIAGSKSLGMLLVYDLARQIGGSVQYENRNGAYFVITFTNRDARKKSD